MAGLVFFYEDVDTDVYSGDPSTLAVWSYAAKLAGDVDNIVVVNTTDQRLTSPDQAMGFEVLPDIEHLDAIQGHKTIVCCPWSGIVGAESLYTFSHDTEWYMFGPASGWLIPPLYDSAVYVPQAGNGACHATHVATAVMFDRYRAGMDL